jgi:glutamate dehydrogenase/leucine dehydrogenase
VAIQGFGNVGSISATLLAAGAKVVAITDWKGGVYNPAGPTSEALDYVKQQRTVEGFAGGDPIANNQLFKLDVDVLIPAALENQITMENAPAICAKVVVEAPTARRP